MRCGLDLAVGWLLDWIRSEGNMCAGQCDAMPCFTALIPYDNVDVLLRMVLS